MLTRNINNTQVKLDNGWMVSVRYYPYGDSVEVWLARGIGESTEICHFDNKGHGIMTKIKEGAEPEPTMRIQSFIWDGIKNAINGTEETPEKKEIVGELSATKYHLEDLRKLLKL